MFDRKKFAQILKQIKDTYNSQEEFSEKSKIGRTYLSQYMNMKLDKPPKPEKKSVKKKHPHKKFNFFKKKSDKPQVKKHHKKSKFQFKKHNKKKTKFFQKNKKKEIKKHQKRQKQIHKTRKNGHKKPFRFKFFKKK